MPSMRVFDADLLRDKVAIVTGGGSGIGLAVAQLFLRLGARVAICGRNEERLARGAAALVANVPATPERVFARTCDIREATSVDAFVEAVGAALGPAHVLVNNAGGQFPAAAAHTSVKGFEAVIRNNLVG